MHVKKDFSGIYISQFRSHIRFFSLSDLFMSIHEPGICESDVTTHVTFIAVPLFIRENTGSSY